MHTSRSRAESVFNNPFANEPRHSSVTPSTEHTHIPTSNASLMSRRPAPPRAPPRFDEEISRPVPQPRSNVHDTHTSAPKAAPPRNSATASDLHLSRPSLQTVSKNEAGLSVKSICDKLKSMEDALKSVQRSSKSQTPEILNLTKKCDEMGESIRTLEGSVEDLWSCCEGFKDENEILGRSVTQLQDEMASTRDTLAELQEAIRSGTLPGNAQVGHEGRLDPRSAAQAHEREVMINVRYSLC
jgi:hypothetical protein